MPDSPGLSDDELLQRAAQGSESALSELYDRYATLLFGVARSIAAEPEPVLSDAFVDVVAHAGQGLAGRGSVRATLVSAVRRRALAQVRGRGKQKVPSPGSAGPMEQTLRQLGVSEREAVQLASLGLAEADIAKRLEESPAVIRGRIRTGMEKLRELLTPASAPPPTSAA